MYELLGEQDIVSDATAIDKKPLLRSDQTRHNQL